MDCFFYRLFDAIATERVADVEVNSEPSRPQAEESAAVATSKQALEQFRQYLLERVPDAARLKLRGVSSTEAASGNGLRELWEKSDLPSGIFADEVAGFWKLPRAGPAASDECCQVRLSSSRRDFARIFGFPFSVGGRRIWPGRVRPGRWRCDQGSRDRLRSPRRDRRCVL